MAWTLTKGLKNVNAEFDEAFPKRDKASDGTVGDLAHQSGRSGHNPDRTGKAEYRDGDGLDEVRATDRDKDLRNPKVSMEQVIQYLVQQGRKGVYLPFRYFIYRGRIWKKANGWKTEKYTGRNGHYEHAHFSGDWTQKADNWSGKLGLVALVKKLTAPPAPTKPAPAKPKPPAGTKPPVQSGTHKPGSRTISAALKSRGDDVKFVQKWIGKKRMGPADGIAGPRFTSGVKWYQGVRNLKQTGVVDKGGATWKAMGK